MSWDNIRHIFAKRNGSAVDEVRRIEPRTMTERETSWVRDILHANAEWRTADISLTRVVAEGPCCEGISFFLEAPEPENPDVKSNRESVGNLWINTNDGCAINIQLSHSKGRLSEIYVLFFDAKHPKTKVA